MTFDASLLKKIDQYRLIRNQLAHEFGEIGKESTKKIRDIVASDMHLAIDDWGYTEFVIMEDGFLDEFIALIKQLFSAIDKQTKEKLKIRLVNPRG